MDRKRITEELKRRAEHDDEDVRVIAQALIKSFNKKSDNWIEEVLKSEKMTIYKSTLEIVLLLEKIVLWNFLEELWTSFINNDKDFLKKLEKTRKKCKEMNFEGWLNIVKNISTQEALSLAGKPIQTHRVNRYYGIMRKLSIILDLKSGLKPLILLDAGSPSAAGLYAAKESGVRVKTWIALDKQETKENIAWIFTCSVRIGEISDGSFFKLLRSMQCEEKGTKIVRGDMENIPRSVLRLKPDIYIAQFSFYQLNYPQKAFREAVKAVRRQGYIIITDYIYNNDKNIFKILSPRRSTGIKSLVWKKVSDKWLMMIGTINWKDTDLKGGDFEELNRRQKVDRIKITT